MFAVIRCRIFCPVVCYPRIKDEDVQNIILPVLYGRVTWSLTLKEGHSLRVFGERVLRRIFVSNRDKVIEVWRKLHNEQLNDLYSPNTV
jgi:hypothetical protein